MRQHLITYVAVVGVLMVLDALWLGVAKGLNFYAQLVFIGMRNLIFTCYVLCRTEVSSKIKYINQTRKTLH